MKTKFTISLPPDVAEFVEGQCLAIQRRFPKAKFTRQMLVELYFRYGCMAISGIFASSDSLISALGVLEDAALKSLEKVFCSKGDMKTLVADAKAGLKGLGLNVNGTAIVPDKPVRAVSKSKDWSTCMNCEGKTLPTGKPCPACRPPSAGLKPKPAKKPALRLVKK